MFLKKFLFGAVVSLVAFTNVTYASENAVRDKFKAMLPDAVINNIAASPVADFYQIQVDSGKVFYMSKDGKYLLQGYLFDLSNKEPKNLTLAAEEEFVAKLLSGIDRSKMVIYPAKGAPKASITIFTDTTCPYCHRLHQEVPMLNANGIEVRYLAYPREGFASKGFEELQKVWCADNKNEAMDQLMSETPVKSIKKCNNPVIEQYVLGQKIGIRGTPAIILQNGHIIPGYQPANQLISEALKAAEQAKTLH